MKFDKKLLKNPWVYGIGSGVIVAIFIYIFLTPKPTNLGDSYSVTNSGINYGVVAGQVNIGKTQRHVGEDTINSLNLNIPKDKNIKIMILSVSGDQESAQFANEILNYLTKLGYKSIVSGQSLFTQPIPGLSGDILTNGTFRIIVGSNN